MKEKIKKIFSIIISKLAKKYINKHSPIVIGITGSIGKTSSRIIIYQILQKFLPNKIIYTSNKNFNGQIGLIFSIFKIENYGIISNFFKILLKTLFGKKEYDIILLEYGIDSPQEMNFLTNIVKPDISIITGVDKVHSENFKNLDELIKQKYLLALKTKKTTFLNYNDAFWPKFYNQIKIDKFLFTISDYFKKKDNFPDIYFENYQLLVENEIIKSKAKIFLKNKKIDVKTNLIGKENFGYIGVGLAITSILTYQQNIDFKLPDKLDLNFNLLPGRFSIFKGLYDSLIIDSSYNAAPKSMKKVLETAYNIKKELLTDYKLILILGEMRELGDFAETEHRKLAAIVSQISDNIYFIGTNMKYLQDELKKINYQGNIQAFKDSISLGKKLKQDLEKLNGKKIVVFKGSQNTIFLEEAIKQILKNPKDIKYLPRQDKSWNKIKKKYFEKIKN